MKVLKFSLFLLLVCISSGAQDSTIDYYTDKTEVKGSTITYSVKHDRDYRIVVENKNNCLEEFPRNTIDGHYLYADKTPRVQIRENELDSLTKMVFSVEEIAMLKSDVKGCYIIMSFKASPETKTILEMRFDISTRDNKKLFAISPQKLEQLETLLKEELTLFFRKDEKGSWARGGGIIYFKDL